MTQFTVVAVVSKVIVTGQGQVDVRVAVADCVQKYVIGIRWLRFQDVEERLEYLYQHVHACTCTCTCT